MWDNWWTPNAPLCLIRQNSKSSTITVKSWKARKILKRIVDRDMQPKTNHKKSNQDFSKFKIQNQVSKSQTINSQAFSRVEQPAIEKSNQAESNPPVTFYEANSVYDCANTKDLVRFLHAAALSPVADTWIKAIKAGHFSTWPGLT
jgi:hypothetical protein